MGDLEGLGFWYLAQYTLEDDDDTPSDDGDGDDNNIKEPASKKLVKKPTYENLYDRDDYNEDDEENSLSTYL